MSWNNHIVSEVEPNMTICFMSHDGTAANAQGEANAALIVTAVNAYEPDQARIEALEAEVERLRKALEHSADDFDLIEQRILGGQHQRAKGTAMAGQKEARAALEAKP
jgi:molecular chaperone GrpE (heat shock protein)